MRSISPTKGSAKRRTHSPCRTADARVLAPALTLAELRTITPVMGSPPIAPDTIFALPCPTNSRSKFVRGPLCILSTDTADNRLSTLAMSATVSTLAATAPQLPSGRLGSWNASTSDPSMLMRGTANGNTMETSVTPTIATSWPGTIARRAGTHRQATNVAMTSRPSKRPGPCGASNCWGSSTEFVHAELCELPPSSTCAC